MALDDRSNDRSRFPFPFIIVLTFRVMLSVGASCLTLLQQPTKTASDAVATMFALAGMGRNAGASDRRRRSRCDRGAGRASSWPSTCEDEAAAAAGLTAVVAAMMREGGRESGKKERFLRFGKEKRKERE